MSVLTGLISGAAKGALDAGKVVMDQELKKQLLEIQAQKELMLAEARSRLDVEGYKAKGDYDTSQIAVKTAATANATKDNASILGEAAAAQESAKYTAGKPTREQQDVDARTKADADKKAEANTYMSKEVQAAEERKARLSPAVIAAGIQRQISDGAVTLQQTADGKLMKVDKRGNTLGYLTDPDGKAVQGTKDITTSQLALAKSYFDEAAAEDKKDTVLDPAAAKRAEAARAKGQNIILYGVADGKPKAAAAAADADPMAAAGYTPKAAAKAESAPDLKTDPAPAPKTEASAKTPGLIRNEIPQNSLFAISDFTKNEGANKARNELAILEKRYPVVSARPDGAAKKIAELKAQINGAQ